MTAPTGTSPAAAARSARRSAAAIPAWSWGDASGMRRRGLRLRGNPLERDGHTVLGAVDLHAVALGVTAPEHRQRQWVLDQPLNRPLQRPRTVYGIVSLRPDHLLCRRRDFQSELPFGE